jgi:feruloyl esterase
MRRSVLEPGWLCVAVFAGLLARPAAAGEALPCVDLAGLQIESTNLLSATVVPARDDLPEHCRVLGYVRPAINFEVRLPARGWNGKFLMVGCGGFCGAVDSEQSAPVHSINYGLRRGYAVSTMDSGHWGTSGGDGRWAWNNRLAEIDWAERAVTETARVTKVVIEAFYGRPPQRSYFSGCSNGGRMAAMEAQRHPEDFDGIISGCPSLAASSLHLFFTWLVRANVGPDGKDVLSGSKVGVVAGAVLKLCDARDGLEDGILSDPLACDFTPASLACKSAASDSCLTEAEVKALEKWYEGPRNSRGERLYPGGLPRGSEPYWSHWWLTGRDPDGPRPVLVRLAEDSLRYLAFPDDPGDRYDVSSFDFDLDPPRVRFMGALYDATDPDLAPFKARGGKLLMYQGWADPAVTPQRTVEYHAAVEKAMGGREAVAGFYRLFMVPAMGHCGVEPDGPGITATGFDPLTALERWVEQGVAPDSLLATKTDKEGKTLWTRPLCPHPQVARYDGKGDPKDAASFACATP